MANRLAAATSPYLLQHRDNPVDWWEWEPAAFAEAAERDVPVFLSVGYSACHWCHVMAHQSFEDDEVARVLNGGYVCVKVDREERPDVDAVYMAATQALTGQGGWPMTVLMTPEREPFFCGTYFPKAQLLQVLDAISDAWRSRREEVLASSTHIVGALRQSTAPPPHALTTGHLDAAAAALRPQFDSARGGFGRAPKFPPSLTLEFLLRHHGRTGDAGALEMVDATCTAMARGGIYDQLAGGFARYSVDVAWVVPHFEKMLYDNALLTRVYAHWCTLDRFTTRRADRPGDSGFHAPRPRYARRRLRQRTRRRRGGGRGPHVRVEPAPARRGARAPTTPSGPPTCSGSPPTGRSRTACPPSSCRSTRTTSTGGRT